MYRLEAQRWLFAEGYPCLRQWASELRTIGADADAAPLAVWSALRQALRCLERAQFAGAALAPCEAAEVRSSVAVAAVDVVAALAQFGYVGIIGEDARVHACV